MDDTLSITSLPTDTQQQLIDDHAKEVATEDKTIIHKSIDNINDGESKSQTYAQSLDVFNESNKLKSCAQPDDDAQNEILAEGADNTGIKKDANITYESKNVCRDDDRPKIDKKKEQNEAKKRMKVEAKKEAEEAAKRKAQMDSNKESDATNLREEIQRLSTELSSTQEQLAEEQQRSREALASAKAKEHELEEALASIEEMRSEMDVLQSQAISTGTTATSSDKEEEQADVSHQS